MLFKFVEQSLRKPPTGKNRIDVLREAWLSAWFASACPDQRIEQNQLPAFPGGEVMRRSFGYVADRSRAKRDAPPMNAQASASFEDVTDDVFVVVVDLLGIGACAGTEGN